MSRVRVATYDRCGHRYVMLADRYAPGVCPVCWRGQLMWTSSGNPLVLWALGWVWRIVNGRRR